MPPCAIGLKSIAQFLSPRHRRWSARPAKADGPFRPWGFFGESVLRQDQAASPGSDAKAWKPLSFPVPSRNCSSMAPVAAAPSGAILMTGMPRATIRTGCRFPPGTPKPPGRSSPWWPWNIGMFRLYPLWLSDWPGPVPYRVSTMAAIGLPTSSWEPRWALPAAGPSSTGTATLRTLQRLRHPLWAFRYLFENIALYKSSSSLIFFLLAGKPVVR